MPDVITRDFVSLAAASESEVARNKSEDARPWRVDALKQNLEPIFVFAIVWGIGGLGVLGLGSYIRTYNHIELGLRFSEYGLGFGGLRFSQPVSTVRVR